VQVATTLPPLWHCGAEPVLRARLPAPRPDQCAAVDALRAQLARASALHDAGEYVDSLRAADATAIAECGGPGRDVALGRQDLALPHDAREHRRNLADVILVERRYGSAAPTVRRRKARASLSAARCVRASNGG